MAGHGLVKAALFLCTGIILHRLGSVNESWLHGRGRSLRVTGVVFTLAGLGLADLPPFATFLGKGWIDVSAGAHGLPWLMAVFIVCSILTGGAVLRVAGGVFYGLGDPPSEDPVMARAADEEKSETDSGKQRTPLTMIIPPAVLVAIAFAMGFLTPLGPAAAESAGVTTASVLAGTGSAAGAVVLAFLALYWRRLPLLRRGFEPGTGLTTVLARFQSGVVSDYVTWIVLGLGCLGGVLTLVLR